MLDIAERGMLNNFSPLPLKNEPVNKNILPVNWEPLCKDSTLNPYLSSTDAVTEPVAINVAIKASGVNAVLGILNNFSPLPLKNEPDVTDILPLTIKEPVNCEPLAKDCTLNPSLSDTEAVTLPLAILNTSSDKAERGILNNPLPSPLNNDADNEPDILTLPVNCEPLADDCTLNPKFGEVDAVTEPDNILVVSSASSVNAVLGILNNFSPLPLKNEPDVTDTFPETTTLPVNCEPLAKDSTLNPKLGETEAVTEPERILKGVNDKADSGISNNNLPLPLINEPLAIKILPLKIEPLSNDFTTNPSGETEAVTLPLANFVAWGKLNKFAPSPKNEPVKEPLNEPVASAIPINEPVKAPAIDEPVITLANNLSLTSTEPVNCCTSDSSSPKIFEPDE